jgi:dTDP-4-amino-4,6-dideoxygalactose transaminase
MQAAIVLAKLPYLDGWTAARQRNATRYDRLIGELGGAVRRPAILTDRHIFNQYVIRVLRRDELQAYLKDQGISTEVYYPVPMHLQECFAKLGYTVGDFPESERAANETLALPVYPELTSAQAEYVVRRLVEFFANGPALIHSAAQEPQPVAR